MLALTFLQKSDCSSFITKGTPGSPTRLYAHLQRFPLIQPFTSCACDTEKFLILLCFLPDSPEIIRFNQKMKTQNPTSLFRVNHTPFRGNSLTFRVKVWLQSVCQYLFFLPDLLIFAISLNFAFFASRYRLPSAA